MEIVEERHGGRSAGCHGAGRGNRIGYGDLYRDRRGAHEARPLAARRAVCRAVQRPAEQYQQVAGLRELLAGPAGLPAKNVQLRCVRSASVPRVQPDLAGPAAAPERGRGDAFAGLEPGRRAGGGAMVWRGGQRAGQRQPGGDFERALEPSGRRPEDRRPGPYDGREAVHGNRCHARLVSTSAGRFGRERRIPDRRLGANQSARPQQKAGCIRVLLLRQAQARRIHGPSRRGRQTRGGRDCERESERTPGLHRPYC